MVWNYVTLAMQGFHSLAFLLVAALLFRLTLPATLVRRQYNYNYVRELVSCSRRGRCLSMSEIQREYHVVDSGLPVYYKCFNQDTHQMEHFTDLVAYAIRARELGATDIGIANAIETATSRMREVEIRYGVKRHKPQAQTLVAAMLDKIYPDMSGVANPHARLRITCDGTVPGNFWGEWFVLPVRIKQSVALNVVLSLALIIVVYILRPKLTIQNLNLNLNPNPTWRPKLMGCLDRIKIGDCEVDGLNINQYAIEEIVSQSIAKGSKMQIGCDSCTWWMQNFWFLTYGFFSVNDFNAWSGNFRSFMDTFGASRLNATSMFAVNASSWPNQTSIRQDLRQTEHRKPGRRLNQNHNNPNPNPMMRGTLRDLRRGPSCSSRNARIPWR